VIRDDELQANPGADFRFQRDDLVATIGTHRARAAFQAMVATN
jgi:K+/H+ antiporter YhaU regulatory subunit KhtT